MRIGIISDSHDDIINVKHAIKIFNEYKVDLCHSCRRLRISCIVLEFKNLKKNSSLWVSWEITTVKKLVLLKVLQQ